MRRETAFHLQTILLQVMEHLRQLFFQSSLKSCCHVFQLGEVLCVNRTPVALLHQLEQAPEDLLFILVVKEKQADYVIHALHVAHLVVVVRVCLQHIE